MHRHPQAIMMDTVEKLTGKVHLGHQSVLPNHTELAVPLLNQEKERHLDLHTETQFPPTG